MHYQFTIAATVTVDIEAESLDAASTTVAT
jgi:hypothetical protein